MLHADWEQSVKKPLKAVQNLADAQSGQIQITFAPL